jgi:hypothetical protein
MNMCYITHGAFITNLRSIRSVDAKIRIFKMANLHLRHVSLIDPYM